MPCSMRYVSAQNLRQTRLTSIQEGSAVSEGKEEEKCSSLLFRDECGPDNDFIALPHFLAGWRKIHQLVYESYKRLPFGVPLNPSAPGRGTFENFGRSRLVLARASRSLTRTCFRLPSHISEQKKRRDPMSAAEDLIRSVAPCAI